MQPTQSRCYPSPGGATTFSKLGVQFLGLGYCTEQNTDGIPSFVHCSLLRNGSHTSSKKLGWSVQIMGGSGPPDPTPSGCALVRRRQYPMIIISDNNNLRSRHFRAFVCWKLISFRLRRLNWLLSIITVGRVSPDAYTPAALHADSPTIRD